MVLRLARSAQRSQRSAMKAVEHTEDLVAARLTVQARDLDGCLVGLGTAVTEKALPAPAGAPAQRFGQASLRLGVPSIGHMNELSDLFLHRFDDARRAMAQQITAPTRKKIEIAIAFIIPHEGTFATHQTHRVARVIGDDVTLKLFESGLFHFRFSVFGFRFLDAPFSENQVN